MTLTAVDKRVLKAICKEQGDGGGADFASVAHRARMDELDLSDRAEDLRGRGLIETAADDEGFTSDDFALTAAGRAALEEGLGELGDTESVAGRTWMQLGPQAKMMIGARDAISSEDGQTVTFKIGRNSKSINWIRIRLDPNDTYTMQFGRGYKRPKVVSQVEGVYNDMLLPVIEDHTGLRTGGIR